MSYTGQLAWAPQPGASKSPRSLEPRSRAIDVEVERALDRIVAGEAEPAQARAELIARFGEASVAAAVAAEVGRIDRQIAEVDALLAEAGQ